MESALNKTLVSLASVETEFGARVQRPHVSIENLHDVVPAAPVTAPVRSRRTAGWASLSSIVFLLLLGLAAAFPNILVHGDPLAANAREAFQAPTLAHPLGTDENGRDVLVRVVHGARPSLLMGIAATAIGLTLGIAFGLIAGLGPRWADSLLMRGVDVMLAYPDILLALLIITFWGQGMWNAIIAVGVASVPRYARLVRAQVQAIAHAGYVEAAMTLGLRRGTIILRHVLPNAIQPVLVLATIGIGAKIAAGAGLSFLGLGTPPPSPEWGAMLSVGRNFLGNAWWITAAPGIAVTLTVLAATTVGRALTKKSGTTNRA